MKHTLFALAVLVATSTTVHADSVEEKTYWKTQQGYIDRSMEELAKRCGATLTFAWVDKPALRAAAEKEKSTPYGICDNIVQQVITICRAGDDEKAAVTEKLKGFTCGHANPRKLELKAGIVKYLGNNEEANFSDWARPWLTKRL